MRKHRYHVGQQIRATAELRSGLPAGSTGIVVLHHYHNGRPVYLCDFGPRGELVAGQDQIQPDLALFDLGAYRD